MRTITADSPAGFLGLVPALLGFTPHESVVLVPFAGSRTLGAMRLDLPASVNEVNFTERTLTIIERVPHCDALAAVVYADVSPMHALRLLEALFLEARERKLRVVDGLYVTPAGWGGIATDLPLNPLGEIPVHPDAPSPEGTQNSQCILPVPTPEQVLAFAEENDPDGRTLWVDSADAIANDPLPLTGSLAAALSLTCTAPAVRDVMLITVLGGTEAGERAVDAQLAWEYGVEYPVELAQMMWGEGARPDPDRLKRMQAHLALTAALDGRAGTRATLAWVCWALGQSTKADCHAKAALAIDPEHGLAQIVESFVRAGHLPDWAFAR